MLQKNFLVEIGVEDIPSILQRNLAQAFLCNIKQEFNTKKILYDNDRWFASSRRIAVNLRLFIDDKLFNKIFNLKNKIKNTNMLCCQNVYKISCNHYANVENVEINEMFCTLVSNSLILLPIKKRMRWSSSNNISFIRPIRTVTILLDNRLIVGSVLNINVCRIIKGHRFLGKQNIILDHANNYLKVLMQEGSVIADYEIRKNKIFLEINKIFKKVGGISYVDDALLEEVTSFVEWPVVLFSKISLEFLKLPSELLILIMQRDCKCFPVYDKKHQLLPYYIFVSNIESKDSKQIIIGYDRVISQRLSDAVFFIKNDLKYQLDYYLNKLTSIKFHNKLGNMLDKSKRIEYLSGWIADIVGVNSKIAKRAGILSKFDLMTSIVFEFPELKGVMGMYYAINLGELQCVALAQKEHYKPCYSKDTLPTTLLSCVVSIADKIDTISGVFIVGANINSSHDPFALRRLAIGIIRIIIENKLSLNISVLVKESVFLYKQHFKLEVLYDVIIDNISKFLFKRLFVFYEEKGFSKNFIRAVFNSKIINLLDFNEKLLAITHFSKTKEKALLISMHRRISKIISKFQGSLNIKVNTELLKEAEEIRLFNKVVNLYSDVKLMSKEYRYKDILTRFCDLYNPLTSFFNNIFIMTEQMELRINRLALLNQLYQLFAQVADFSYLY